MLLRTSRLTDYRLRATDGDFGAVHDLLLEPESGETRYLVADTGRWLPGRRVLLAPASLGQPSPERKTVSVRQTKEEIQHSPPLSDTGPLQCAEVDRLHRYYQWPVFHGDGTTVSHNETGAHGKQDNNGETPPRELSLYSACDLMRLQARTPDGELGFVADLLLNPQTWTVEYYVVDARSIDPRRPVSVPYDTATVACARQLLQITHVHETLQQSPELHDDAVFSPADRDAIQAYYRELPDTTQIKEQL